MLSADGAAAAEASRYPSEHQADWDSGEVVVTLIINLFRDDLEMGVENTAITN